jgi:hypothetical protein
MMVTVKYVLIILHADNEGEGGTFSCYSLLSRYVSLITITTSRAGPLTICPGQHHKKRPARNVHGEDGKIQNWRS